jgi:hypothetical protein
VTLDQWLGLGVFLAAIAGSSITWYALALRCSFPQGLAAVPTIALDLGGLVYGRNWIRGSTWRLRRWGRITTILAVLISVAGNGIEHAIAAGLFPVDLWLVLAVGAVPAAALFAIAHQFALAGEPVERVNASTQVPGERHGEASRVNGLAADRAALAADRAALAADQEAIAGDFRRAAERLAAEKPEPEPEPEDEDEPEPESSTVVELSQRPAEGTKLARARVEYRARADELLRKGRSLDDIVLADVDRAAGAAVGYAKRHARRWRAEIEAERDGQERGEG